MNIGEFIASMGRGGAPAGETNPAMQQGLLQFGAGLLSNPTGNFGRNVGAAIGPALSRHNEVDKLSAYQAAQSAAAQSAAAETEAKRREMMVKGLTAQGAALDNQIRTTAMNGGDPSQLIAQKTALMGQISSIYGLKPQGGAPQAPTAGAGAPNTAQGAALPGPGSVAPSAALSAPAGQNGGAPLSPHATALSHAQNAAKYGLGAPDIQAMSRLAEASKPFSLSAGSTAVNADGTQSYVPKLPDGMVPGPNGSARLMPNFTAASGQAEAAIATARNRASARESLIDVQMPDGSTRKVRAGDVMGGGAPGGTGQPGVQTGASAAQRANTADYPALLSNFTDKVQPEIMANLSASREQLSGLIVQRDLLASGKLSTGFGQEAINKIVAPFARLGFSGLSEQASIAEVFDSLTSRQVNLRLMLQKGMQTEGDAERARREVASLGKTPEANKFIMNYLIASLERQILHDDGLLAWKQQVVQPGSTERFDPSKWTMEFNRTVPNVSARLGLK